MPEIPNPVHAALVDLPHLSHLRKDDYSVTRLGGLTNLVYRVQTKDEILIVRLPGEGTGAYIDRAAELHNAHAAARAGVSAAIIQADPKSGVMISRCIENVETMTPGLFKSRAGAPARAGNALRRLHGGAEQFQSRFDLFAMIDDYLDILSGKDADLLPGYGAVVRAAEPVKRALQGAPAILTPCHCDPLCENFLDDGSRMWIVDWEYSGMNDPMFDLGDLSVEAGFDGEQDAALLRAYFERPPTPAEAGRMVIYKAMCDLLWTLWGLIQHANGNAAEDFHAYAAARFARCQTLVNGPGFQASLRAIKADQR